MPFAALPNTIFFAVAGILIFVVALLTLLRVLPGQIWTRILGGDMAAALVVAALALALGCNRCRSLITLENVFAVNGLWKS